MSGQVTATTEFLAVWQALAFERVRFLAATMPAFSTDDLWSEIETLPKPTDPRALGPVMQGAQAAKLIAKSDFTTTSQRPACHARPIAVWLSVPRSGSLTDAAAYVTLRKGAKTLCAPVFGFLEEATAAAT
jgi:hypothetical protein